MSATDRGEPAGRLAARLPILCLVTDVGVAGGDTRRVAEIVAASVRGGVNMVQVRDPAATDDEFENLVGLVSEAASGNASVVANIGGRDRIPVHAIVDGYHLPESEARRLPRLLDQAPTGTLVGASAHSTQSALLAESCGAHYVTLGTVFPSASHPGGESQGLSLIEGASALVRIPVVGIGGVTSAMVSGVMRAGASGVAVIRAIASAPDPSEAAGELAQLVRSEWEDSRVS